MDEPVEYTREEAQEVIEEEYAKQEVKSPIKQVWCGLVRSHDRSRAAVTVAYGPNDMFAVPLLWCGDCGKRLSLDL